MGTHDGSTRPLSGKRSLTSLLATLISLTWYAAMVLLVLSVGLLAAAPWVDPPKVQVEFAVPTAFRLETDTHRITASPDVEGVHLEHAKGSLLFSPRSRVAVATAMTVVVAGLGAVLWVLAQLRAVFWSLRAGRPFVSANAVRIRRVGYAVIGAELARSLLTNGGMRYAMSNFAIQGVRLETRFDFDPLALVCGLIILVIAEVFREGTRLAEEQSLTI